VGGTRPQRSAEEYAEAEILAYITLLTGIKKKYKKQGRKQCLNWHLAGNINTGETGPPKEEGSEKGRE